MNTYTREETVRIGNSMKNWNVDWVDAENSWIDISFTDANRPKSHVLSRRVRTDGSVKITKVDVNAETWGN
jgi:hypothetical protein